MPRAATHVVVTSVDCSRTTFTHAEPIRADREQRLQTVRARLTDVRTFQVLITTARGAQRLFEWDDLMDTAQTAVVVESAAGVRLASMTTIPTTTTTYHHVVLRLDPALQITQVQLRNMHPRTTADAVTVDHVSVEAFCEPWFASPLVELVQGEVVGELTTYPVGTLREALQTPRHLLHFVDDDDVTCLWLAWDVPLAATPRRMNLTLNAEKPFVSVLDLPRDYLRLHDKDDARVAVAEADWHEGGVLLRLEEGTTTAADTLFVTVENNALNDEDRYGKLQTYGPLRIVGQDLRGLDLSFLDVDEVDDLSDSIVDLRTRLGASLGTEQVLDLGAVHMSVGESFEGTHMFTSMDFRHTDFDARLPVALDAPLGQSSALTGAGLVRGTTADVAMADVAAYVERPACAATRSGTGPCST